MKNVKAWGRQDRIRKVYVRVREWRTEVRSGKERTRVRVTAAVVGNSRSKTRDLDRYEERDRQTAVWLHTPICRRTRDHTEFSRGLYKVSLRSGCRSVNRAHAHGIQLRDERCIIRWIWAEIRHAGSADLLAPPRWSAQPIFFLVAVAVILVQSNHTTPPRLGHGRLDIMMMSKRYTG